MKKITLFILLFTSIGTAQNLFTKYFTGSTLRFDFHHYGNKEIENISLDKMIEEGEWSGSTKNLIDTLFWGNYFFTLTDSASNNLIYSRGFSTLYQEWQTTEESKSITRVFEGSISIPFPINKSLLEIKRRKRKNEFVTLYKTIINPNDYFIVRGRSKHYDNFKIHYSGNPKEKLDIVFIPEGYTLAEMQKFKNDCSRLAGYLFEYSPFKENADKFNIWGVSAPSIESGTDIPGQNIWKETLVNSRFYTFDSERYLMTTNYFSVKDIAANAPYDQIYIVVNTAKYGGGAIYNFYSLTGADNKLAKQVFVHEFGHGVAGLADEYGNDNTYQDMYPPDVEPWEVNLTTLVNFDSKWKNMINQSTPIPTPNNAEFKEKIGVFEGGGYVPKGVYRPTSNSIMNSFSSNEFNQVCKDALIKIINFYSE